MKNIYILIILLFISLIVSMFFYLDDSVFISNDVIGWKYKEKEIKSRLLAIPILLYHNIDGKGPFSIKLEVLKKHFRLIKDRGIRVISLKELISRLENPVPFKEKVIVITFDDGYYSMYSRLLPLAREFSYPITLFVYTDFIFTKAKNNLNWKMLKELDKEGIDIQGHSISHPDLTELSKKDDQFSRRKLFEEIYLSKRIIELYMGKDITFFAFPYGRYDLNIIEMTSYSGYRRVFSTDYGSNIITRDNYCLRRQHIKRNYSLRFIDRLIR